MSFVCKFFPQVAHWPTRDGIWKQKCQIEFPFRKHMLQYKILTRPRNALGVGHPYKNETHAFMRREVHFEKLTKTPMKTYIYRVFVLNEIDVLKTMFDRNQFSSRTCINRCLPFYFRVIAQVVHERWTAKVDVDCKPNKTYIRTRRFVFD